MYYLSIPYEKCIDTPVYKDESPKLKWVLILIRIEHNVNKQNVLPVYSDASTTNEQFTT